jgi:hypothetical protein
MEHYARIWCQDCTGEDFMGCFEGSTELLGPFATVKEADKAGYEHTKDCGPWYWEVTTSDPEKSSEQPSTASETSACSSDDPPESD